MTGSTSGAGLPDYLTILNSTTTWYEVKTTPRTYISLKDFTPAQIREFPKMITAGATIYIFIRKNKRNYTILFDQILKHDIPL